MGQRPRPGVRVGGALFHCQCLGPTETRDAIYHLSIKYPHRGLAGAGLPAPAPPPGRKKLTAWERKAMDPGTPPPLSGDLALSTCFPNQPPSHLVDLRPALLGSCPSQARSPLLYM